MNFSAGCVFHGGAGEVSILYRGTVQYLQPEVSQHVSRLGTLALNGVDGDLSTLISSPVTQAGVVQVGDAPREP